MSMFALAKDVSESAWLRVDEDTTVQSSPGPGRPRNTYRLGEVAAVGKVSLPKLDDPDAGSEIGFCEMRGDRLGSRGRLAEFDADLAHRPLDRRVRRERNLLLLPWRWPPEDRPAGRSSLRMPPMSVVPT